MSCIRGVQSCVLSSNYKQKAFFTKHTVDSVRGAINGAREFMDLSSYDPWERICSGGQGDFVTRYSSCLILSSLVRKGNHMTLCAVLTNGSESCSLLREGKLQLSHSPRVHLRRFLDFLLPCPLIKLICILVWVHC